MPHKDHSDGQKDASELSDVTDAYVCRDIITDCKEQKSNILARSRSKVLTPNLVNFSQLVKILNFETHRKHGLLTGYFCS